MTSDRQHYVVQRGALWIYRLFDVADAIDLDAAATLIQTGGIVQTSGTRRLSLNRLPQGQVSMPQPPLSVSLGDRKISVDGVEYAIDCKAQVFDFGVISLVLKARLPAGRTLAELVPLNAQLSSHGQVEKLAKDLSRELFDQLKATMEKAAISGFVEDYTVIYIEEFSEPPDLDKLRHDPTLARLLLGETSPRGLAPYASNDATRIAFSYYADELAVIDWNSAFIYDRGNDPDIPSLIEFASAQLLELRYYDDFLDRELSRVYIETERVRGGIRRGAQLRALTRQLLQVVLEVTELTEKIDNSIKWVGDLYLAQVYQAAAAQFNLSRWQQQAERKLSLLTRTTELLSDQITTDRSLWLEVGVVVLILIELVLAFLRH